MTEVYSGTLSVAGDNHAMEIPFNSNNSKYTYNGGNLLVDFSVTVKGNYQSQSWMVISTSTNTACSVYSSNNPANYKYLPTTTITYIPGSEPDCYAPKDLDADNILSSSADLSWTKSSQTTTCTLRYRSENDTEWTVKDDVESPYTSYELTGLDGNTQYEFQVMGLCNGNDTEWSSSYFFTTECSAFGIPYNYGFETATDLNCWTVIGADNETGIYTYSNVGYESNSTFRFKYSTTVDQYLISPELSGVTSLGVKVTFYYKCFNSYYTETFKVGYSTTDNATASFGNWDEVSYQSQDWAEYSYIFPATTKYIAISYPKNDNSRIYIDNITFKTPENTFTATGDWNDATKWSHGTVPTSSDDVIINAACTIPTNRIAEANTITLGTNVSLTLADGGQLVCNNNPVVTVVKHINAANDWEDNANGWNFIASPITTALTTANVNGIVTTGENNDYDLYKFNETDNMWHNYKTASGENPNAASGFSIEFKKGYLYASQNGTNINFTGTIQPYVVAGVPVTLAKENDGWNLIGNPFTFNAQINKGFYVINGNRVVANTGSTVIAPCTGVIVKADSDEETVTFTKPTEEAPTPSNLNMYVAQQVVTRGSSSMSTLDNAILSFNEGSQLEKFYFMQQNANLYIPQGNEEYAIVNAQAQGEMPVNFRANENGQYTLTVNAENVEMNYLHLIDNMTGDDIDLLATPSYTFNAKTTDYESRFRLVFAANNSNEESNSENATFAFFANGNLIVNNEGEATLQVIDMTGRMLRNETINGSANLGINAPAGVYLLRLVNGNNVKTQKVVVK